MSDLQTTLADIGRAHKDILVSVEKTLVPSRFSLEKPLTYTMWTPGHRIHVRLPQNAANKLEARSCTAVYNESAL